MSAQFTKGPWVQQDSVIACINDHMHHVYPIIGEVDNPIEPTGIALCILPVIDANTKTKAYMDANARLIAASPTMYELIKRVAELGMTHGEESAELFELWQQAEAVLDQLKG